MTGTFYHRLINQPSLILHHPWLRNDITGELNHHFNDQAFVLSRRGKGEAFVLKLIFSFLILVRVKIIICNLL